MMHSKKPSKITVKSHGVPSEVALAAFAQLLLSIEQARPKLQLVESTNDQGSSLPPLIKGQV